MINLIRKLLSLNFVSQSHTEMVDYFLVHHVVSHEALRHIIEDEGASSVNFASLTSFKNMGLKKIKFNELRHFH